MTFSTLISFYYRDGTFSITAVIEHRVVTVHLIQLPWSNDFIRKCTMFYFGGHAFKAFPFKFFIFCFLIFSVFFTMDAGEQHKATRVFC